MYEVCRKGAFEVKYELIPFYNSQNNTVHPDVFHFSIGNIGMQIRIQSGLIENCLSIFVSPVVLSPYSTPHNPEWIENVEQMRELLLPLPTDEPLLEYAKLPYDHIQWGKDNVKLFWQREVLQVSSRKVGKHFELQFKKLFWDGKKFNIRDGTRKTYSIKESEYDYSLNLSNALTKDKYLELVEDNNLEDKNSYNSFIRKEHKKEKANKLLSYVGLKLKDT